VNYPSRRASAALIAIIGAGLAVSCGGDDEVQPPKPATPPTMAIASLTSAGGPQWKRGDSDTCVERGRDDRDTIVLTVSLTDFVLRPPGTCNVNACGQLLVRVDPSGDSEAVRIGAAQTSVDLPFNDLPDGSHTLRAELNYTSGKSVLDVDKNPLVDEVTVDLRPIGGCTGATDAGTDAPTDAAIDAANDGASDASDDADTGTDAPTDASSDADAGPDAPTDAPSDAPTDTKPG
jgi:hypothetical protein